MSYLAAAKAEAAKAKASAYATATAALTAATAAVKAGAAPSIEAALAKAGGTYTYEWTFNWHVWRRLYDVDTSEVIRKVESKCREKANEQKAVLRVLSVTTTIDKKWHEYVLGVYHSHVSATTKTVFTSNVVPTAKKSPLTGFEEALIIIAVIAVIALIVGYTMCKVSSDVKEVLKVPEVAKAVEKAAEALPALAVGGTVVVLALVGLYVWTKRKK